jgi:predicted unusual protein kinase regulating ubiquinone biosynthesis (AarF/ABC1/UbiB family)
MAKKPAPKTASENTLVGRVRRYTQVGTAMGGIATRMATQRVFKTEPNRERNAEELKHILGGLKGPLMKVAQILATIPDALPQEYARELAQLQANAPRMGWPFVNRRMTAELGQGWQDKFADFEREASRAASLGQVHRAKSHDGQALACKLQYPDMDSAVEADLKQLKVLFAAYRRFDPAIDPSNIHAEIGARLREELDYTNEAKNLGLYRHMLAREKGVHVPEVIEPLSTRRLLTMTWMEGRAFADVAEEADQKTRDAIAINMYRAWYIPFYQFGAIHGDPHLGNYTVRDDATVNLMDFGAIRIFSAPFVKGVIDLYKALETNDRALAVSAYETWGFTNLTNEMIDTLSLWAAFIYGPLLEDRPRLIEESNKITQGRETAAKVHAELRRLGGVKPPREFVLMDRAAIGLGSVFMRLRAHVNWYRLFHETIAGFDVDKLAKVQASALKKVKLERLLDAD